MSLNRFATLAVVTLVIASCSDSTGNSTIGGLRFVQQPANVTAGQPFTVAVELLDANGSRVSGSNSVSLSTADGGVTGTTTVRASAGLATFSGVAVTKAGENTQLTATSGNVTATSSSFNVARGAPAAAQSTITPSSGTLVAFGGNELLFTFRDQFGNAIPLAPVTITTDLAGSTLIPAAGTTSATGTFATTFRPAATGTAKFSATVDGVSFALSNSYLVQDVCAAAPLSFPGNVTGVIPTGACVLNGFPSAAHRFTTVNEFVTRFTVNAAFPPVFEVSANPPVDNVVLRASSSNQFTTEWLLPAGTYNARVGASTGSGTYSLIGLVGLNDDGCTFRYLAVAGTYTTQRLQGDDCNTDDFDLFTEPDGSRADFFAIQSSRPCTITMRSSVMDSFLVLADWQSLQPIVGDNNSGGGATGKDAQLSVPVCASPTGPLVIVTNHIVPTLGPYTLTISFGSAAPGVAGTGATATSEVTSKRLRR